MIPELGYGATVAALVLALWGAVAAVFHQPRLDRAGRQDAGDLY